MHTTNTKRFRDMAPPPPRRKAHVIDATQYLRDYTDALALLEEAQQSDGNDKQILISLFADALLLARESQGFGIMRDMLALESEALAQAGIPLALYLSGYAVALEKSLHRIRQVL